MSSCAKCKKDFCAKQRIIVCNVCNALLHYHPTDINENCSGLLATELKALDIKSREPFLYFKCETCKSAGREDPVFKLLSELSVQNKEFEKVKNDFNKFSTDKLPVIEKDIKDLLTDFTLLKEKVSDLEKLTKSTTLSSSQLNLNSSRVPNDTTFNCIKEYNARLKKKNNIIIYKFKEAIVNESYNHSVDVSNIVSVLSGIELTTNLSNQNIVRIGKFDSGKIRPVLVKMDVRSDATRVITNWKSLPREIYVSFDYTLDQRTKYSALRKEIIKYNEENKDHDVYKVIRYRNGEPFIMEKAKSNKIVDQSNINCNS